MHVATVYLRLNRTGECRCICLLTSQKYLRNRPPLQNVEGSLSNAVCNVLTVLASTGRLSVYTTWRQSTLCFVDLSSRSSTPSLRGHESATATPSTVDDLTRRHSLHHPASQVLADVPGLIAGRLKSLWSQHYEACRWSFMKTRSQALGLWYSHVLS